MSRAAVLDTLRATSSLLSLVPAGNIIADPKGEGRPDELSPTYFVVLRWGEQDWSPAVKRGPWNLTTWVHSPKERDDSYNTIDDILIIINDTLCAIEELAGSDGWTITTIEPAGGWSGDMDDPGFNTVMKNTGFKVLTRRT